MIKTMRLALLVQIVACVLLRINCKLTTDNQYITTQYNLVRTLLSQDNYNKQVIPLINKETSLNLTFDVSLRRLVDVDEKNQIVTLQMWLRQEWRDPLLKWNPEDYRNITTLNLENDLIWLPDICLYNTVEDSSIMADKIDTSIKLDYSGNISWLSPYIFKSACKIDVTRFPFDSQVCKLEFGSWTYTTESINIVLKEETLDVSQLVKNTEWRVLSGSVKKSDENYPCCTKSYSTITYEVTIERKTLFSLINLILPPLIIVVLSFLTFLLPVECGERISLVMTVLLSMSVFMLYVSGFMPPTSEVVPLIGRFYLACLVVITICLLVTILVVRIHHTMSTIPEWLAVVVNQYLSKVVLMSKPACLAKQGYYEITTDHNHEVPYTKYHNTSSEKNEQVQREEGITQHFIQSCQNDLKTLAAKAKEQKTVKDNCTEWKRIALVFDRLGFIVCLLLFLTFILVIFVK